jgi:hypothetical protein
MYRQLAINGVSYNAIYVSWTRMVNARPIPIQIQINLSVNKVNTLFSIVENHHKTFRIYYNIKFVIQFVCAINWITNLTNVEG